MSLKNLTEDQLVSIKDSLKNDFKSKAITEHYGTARTRDLRDFLESGMGLRANEDITENKGRRVLCKRIIPVFSEEKKSSLLELPRLNFSEMNRKELLIANINTWTVKLHNQAVTLQAIEHYKVESIRIALDFLSDNPFTDMNEFGGTGTALRVIEMWSADPFNEFNRPGVVQNH